MIAKSYSVQSIDTAREQRRERWGGSEKDVVTLSLNVDATLTQVFVFLKHTYLSRWIGFFCSREEFTKKDI
jgi:hypothetical protein